MGTLTFDTLKFSDSLKAAGVPDKQAEAEARALAEAFSTSSADLATKGDLKTETSALRSEIDMLRKDMMAMELRMTVKLGTFIAASAAIIIAVLKVH